MKQTHHLRERVVGDPGAIDDDHELAATTGRFYCKVLSSDGCWGVWKRPHPISGERLILVGTARRECLDHLLIFGRRHFERVLKEFVEHYHHARPHQGLGQRRPCVPVDGIVVADGRVERRDRLGGLIHEYGRAA
jgi:hypothetical protein